ncbi:MAG: hypothetical protein U0694_06570 [Anaerolineae bacterium]
MTFAKICFCGRDGNQLLLMPSAARSPNIRTAVIAAVCGRDSVRAKAFAEQWNVPHYFTDMRR